MKNKNKTFFIFLIFCTFSFIGTYISFSRFFIICDALATLSLIILVGRQIINVWLAYKQGKAGAHLHLWAVGAFGVISAGLAGFMALFSGFFLNMGMQNWFDSTVRTAIENSQKVAEAYFEEHCKVLEHSVRSMAYELNDLCKDTIPSAEVLSSWLTFQTEIRSLNGALIFTAHPKGSHMLLGRSRFSFFLDYEILSSQDMREAHRDLFIRMNDRKDRVLALFEVFPEKNIYLLVSRQIDESVLNKIKSIKLASGAYENLFKERYGLAVQFVWIFCLITFLVILLAVWWGLIVSARFIDPVSIMIAAAERIRLGDLSARVRLRATRIGELDHLGEAFNRMLDRLDQQRLTLETAHEEAVRKERFTSSVLGGISSGVMGLAGKDLQLYYANHVACQLLDITSSHNPLFLKDVAPELQALFYTHEGSAKLQTEHQVVLRRNERALTLRLSWCRLSDHPRDEEAEWVVTFDDVTDLLSAQKKATWADVARRLAHEIKNPLTPIQLSAERLKRRYLRHISPPETEKFQSCVDTIIRHVIHIGTMIQEFSDFARMPQPLMLAQDVLPVCRDLVLFEQHAYPSFQITLKTSLSSLWMECDLAQIYQALFNLFQNAIDSCEERLKDMPTLKPQVLFFIAEEEKFFLFKLVDNGLGIPMGHSETLMAPYVTTKKKGTGLGLSIVKKIVEDHKGVFYFKQRADGQRGLEACIRFAKHKG